MDGTGKQRVPRLAPARPEAVGADKAGALARDDSANGVIRVDPRNPRLLFEPKENGPRYPREAFIYVEALCGRERSGSAQPKSRP